MNWTLHIVATHPLPIPLSSTPNFAPPAWDILLLIVFHRTRYRQDPDRARDRKVRFICAPSFHCIGTFRIAFLSLPLPLHYLLYTSPSSHYMRIDSSTYMHPLPIIACLLLHALLLPTSRPLDCGPFHDRPALFAFIPRQALTDLNHPPLHPMHRAASEIPYSCRRLTNLRETVVYLYVRHLPGQPHANVKRSCAFSNIHSFTFSKFPTRIGTGDSQTDP